MRIVSYRVGNARTPWLAGIERDGRVITASATYNFGDQPATVRALLEAGPAAVEAAQANAKLIFDAGKQEFLSLDSITLGPPVPDPDKIICLGLNYSDHAAEANLAIPEAPVLFTKYRNSLVGPNDPIVLPRTSTQIDYEAELAVVIGRTCKEVSEQDALNYVAGYTIMDDVSARDMQMRTSQWTAGKAIDTFAPMGPGIVPASEIPDPQDLMLTTRVNGQQLQHASSKLMIFSVAKTIEFISSFMTLVPGDIIATGTPAGVGFVRKPPIYLKAGDIVEIEIERIGRLVNKVVAPAQK
ncbi:MAG TPA: fumarylacetoacetate hydrolase family protein [Ktedonobacteraceae bacterium]|nr:fumarylacetoacetate hydrolase family protein [Ktedonobacteraceae bacterium]